MAIGPSTTRRPQTATRGAGYAHVPVTPTIPAALQAKGYGTIGNVFGRYTGKVQPFGQNIGSPATQAALAGRLAPAGSTIPAVGAPAPAPTTADPGAPDPRDATFHTGVAGLLFNNKNQRDDLTQQGAQAGEDFNTMLGRMADTRAQDLLAQNHAANQQGLFYSGQLGKRRDDVEKGYSQREQDARTALDRGNSTRQSALDRLGGFTEDPNSLLGYTATGQAGLDLAGLFGDAIGRRDTAAAGGGGDAAAAGQLGPDAAPATPAPAAPQAGAPADIRIAASASHGGAKWIYHRGASGKWIPIRPA